MLKTSIDAHIGRFILLAPVADGPHYLRIKLVCIIFLLTAKDSESYARGVHSEPRLPNPARGRVRCGA